MFPSDSVPSQRGRVDVKYPPSPPTTGFWDIIIKKLNLGGGHIKAIYLMSEYVFPTAQLILISSPTLYETVSS